MDDEKRKQREHWRQLAEQLGLPFDDEPESEPEPEPAYARPVDPVPAKAESFLETMEVYTPETPVPWPPPVEEAPPFEPILALEQDSFLEDESASVPMAEPADEAPPPRRRSARGGRGRKKADVEPVVAEEEVAAEEESTDADGRGRRRRGGRGRGRKPRAGEDASVAAEARVDAKESVPEEDNSDDDSADLSDWSAPSWNDLIASLYRPER